MSYIKKTLTTGENIIISKRIHWFYWVSFMPFFLLVLGVSSFLFLLISISKIGTTAVKVDIMISLFIFLPSFIGLLCYYIKYISIENVVTNKRIIFKTGFIHADTDELRIERLENIQIKQSILGRIFRYGDLEFKGTGGSPVIFKFIANPISTKKEIETSLYN